jgi:hypothetical protein
MKFFALAIVALHGVSAAAAIQSDYYRLCFPTVTRDLTGDELVSWEDLTAHFLRTEWTIDDPEVRAVAQAWHVPNSSSSSEDDPLPVLVMPDPLAASPNLRAGAACWTVTLQVTVRKLDELPPLFDDNVDDTLYIVLLRMGLPAGIFVSGSEAPSFVTTVTTTQDGDTLTTTTTSTTIEKQASAWFWILAVAVSVGSLVLVVWWCTYLQNNKSLRYLPKNDSKDGMPTAWLEPDEERASSVASSDDSFWTS